MQTHSIKKIRSLNGTKTRLRLSTTMLGMKKRKTVTTLVPSVATANVKVKELASTLTILSTLASGKTTREKVKVLTRTRMVPVTKVSG